MSAPAENSSGFEEAMTSARDAARRWTFSQTVARSSMTCGEIEFIGALASHAIATSPRVSSLTTVVAAGLGVGLRVGVEALARLLPEAALRDEPAQDRRRREALAVLLLGLLELLEHDVEARRRRPS